MTRNIRKPVTRGTLRHGTYRKIATSGTLRHRTHRKPATNSVAKNNRRILYGLTMITRTTVIVTLTL